MKRFLFVIGFLTLGCLVSSAQQFVITPVLNPPAGGCGNPLAFELVLSNNTVYYCAAGQWTLFAGGGVGSNPPFGNIQSGTNTSANMVVGTGATISPTGAGQIFANYLNRYPFASLPSPGTATNQIAVVTDPLATPCSNTDSFCFDNGSAWVRVASPSASGTSAFGGITSGTNTSATMHVGTGGTLDSTGSGVLNANQILGNAVPANAAGILTNNGTGTLTWGGNSPLFSAIASGVNTSMAAVVGSGASLAYSGTGTISANLLLNNPVPINASGCLSNNGAGVLSWAGCSGGGGGGTVNTGSTGQFAFYAANGNAVSPISLGGSGGIGIVSGNLDVTNLVPLTNGSPTISGTWLFGHQFQMTSAASGSTPGSAGTFTYYTNNIDNLLHQVDHSGNDIIVGSGGSGGVTSSVIASFPSAAANTNKLYRGTDANSTQDCSVGGITSNPWSSLCVSNGVSWLPVTQLSDTNVPNYSVDSNSPIWQQWYKGAVAQATTKVVNVFVFGDSVSVCWSGFCGGAGQGPGASDKAHRWVDMFKQVVRDQGLSHGTGMIPITQRITNVGIGADTTVWTLSGTTVQDSTIGPNQTGASGAGNNGSAMVKFATGATATFTTPEAWDHLLAYCMTGPATTGFSVTMDTVGIGNICTATPGANQATVTASLNGAFYGTHTVVFTALGNTSYLYAAQGTNGSTGIDVHNLSTASASCEYYDSNTGGHSAVKTAFTDLFAQHDLDVYPLGVNEQGEGYTVPQFTTCLNNLMGHNATHGTPSQLVMNEHHFFSDGALNFSIYWAAANSVAQTNGAGFMTVGDRWGTYAQALASGKMYSDGVHENSFGALDYLKMFLHKLTNTDDLPLGFTPGYSTAFSIGTGTNNQPFNFNSDTFAIVRATDNNTNTTVGLNSGEAGFEASTAAGTVGWYTWDSGNGGILPGIFAMQGKDGHLKQLQIVNGSSSGMWFGGNISPFLNSGISFGLLENGHLFSASGSLSLTNCGAGATLDGNATDLSGILTVGTAPGTCVVSFAAVYPVKPHVTVSEEGANPIHYVPSTTGITFTGLSAGWVIHYRADY